MDIPSISSDTGCLSIDKYEMNRYFADRHVDSYNYQTSGSPPRLLIHEWHGACRYLVL